MTMRVTRRYVVAYRYFDAFANMASISAVIGSLLFAAYMTGWIGERTFHVHSITSCP